MLHSRNTNISGNIIKHDLRTSTNERTLFFIKKKYISHTLFTKGLMFLWCVRDGWRDIHSEREDFFFPYLLPRTRGCLRLDPLASSSEMPMFGCVSHARLRFSALCVKLTNITIEMDSASGLTWLEIVNITSQSSEEDVGLRVSILNMALVNSLFGIVRKWKEYKVSAKIPFGGYIKKICKINRSPKIN